MTLNTNKKLADKFLLFNNNKKKTNKFKEKFSEWCYVVNFKIQKKMKPI